MRAFPLVASAAVLLVAAPGARAQSPLRYSDCAATGGAVLVQAAATDCATAEQLAALLGVAPAERAGAVLAAAGWNPLRAAPAPRGTFDVVAVADRAAVRLRLRGTAPDLDGFAAGRELVFARGRIVGGRPIPRGAAICTSAFLVRLPGGALGGLSAAHCAGLRSDGLVQRRNAAMRRPPVPGIVLGRVQRTLARRLPLDALVLPVPGGPRRTAQPVVDRGIARPPLPVIGTARPLRGRAICFSGRTSGGDRCGRIADRRAGSVELLLALRTGLLVRCTTVTARQGDSGGPVYTAPARDGSVRAVGLVTLVVGRRSSMCFTPLLPVLQQLRAGLLVGGTG